MLAQGAGPCPTQGDVSVFVIVEVSGSRETCKIFSAWIFTKAKRRITSLERPTRFLVNTCFLHNTTPTCNTALSNTCFSFCKWEESSRERRVVKLSTHVHMKLPLYTSLPITSNTVLALQAGELRSTKPSHTPPRSTFSLVDQWKPKPEPGCTVFSIFSAAVIAS